MSVTYADPGYQADKKARYPVDTKEHAKAAWSYIHKSANAALYSASQLKKIKATIVTALKKFGVTVSDSAKESFIGGNRSFDEIRDLVRDALTARVRSVTGALYCYVWVADITATDVIYTCADEDDLMQCSYSIGDDESVTLGDPIEVVRTYAPATTVRNPPPEADEPPDDDPDDDLESVAVRTSGRVLEAKGTDADGGRVYRVRILAYGDSKNGRRYSEAVMREAVELYEGAKAFDHHRTLEELQTSTIAGLIGHYRDVAAESDGLYGDLHLLPGATHASEALDASIAAQAAGLEPVVGISHDVQAHFRPIVDNGRRLQEAIKIASVDSADVVAKPSAGGKAVRAVAGGDSPTITTEGDTVATKADVLAALKEATDEDLAGVGLTRASKTTESTAPAPTRALEATEATEATPAGEPKGSFLGGLMIERKVTGAGLPAKVIESVTAALPERITEADVDAQIASIKAALGMAERLELRPTVTATVAQESQEKKIAALDAFFAGDFGKGYHSFREAVLDFTGYRPRSWGEDVNRAILRECIGDGQYDTDGRLQGGREARATESLSASSWNLVLGDSITRRLVAEYHQPNLETWRQIVSGTVPINDFRTQRIDRIGGYGVLPAVAQGAVYNPLTSPSNEEVTYAITKRGGTEDVTLEMIANDDVRAISRIPKKLGLAAANTIYQFVWNFVTTNPTIYDATALFTGTAGHANYVANAVGAALSQSSLSAARQLMGAQTAYGDTQDFLRPIPRFLVTGLGLEELAWQLCTSAVALPTPAGSPPDSTGAANTPNLHQGLTPIVLPYVASPSQWWTIADPNLIPTIEMGFYLGRQDPELFTQSDPTVGSVFNADKVTYKIRHIYSGNVLDFRG
ncbi:MAG TPA: DUF6582 domain-containing protein, partial [Trebonia sp.]